MLSGGGLQPFKEIDQLTWDDLKTFEECKLDFFLSQQRKKRAKTSPLEKSTDDLFGHLLPRSLSISWKPMTNLLCFRALSEMYRQAATENDAKEPV